MKIFIIGMGNMGGAIAKSLIKHKGFKIYFASRHIKSLTKNAVKDNEYKHLGTSDFVIAAVKPQDMPRLAEQINHKLNSKSTIISIAAGLSLKNLSRMFRHTKVVRIMPSMTLKAGHGVAFWKASPALSKKEKTKVHKIFSSFTEHFEVKNENLIDAGSIIYGSGPAYFYLLAQHLVNAAVSLGINKSHASKLVGKTFIGSALLQSGQDYQDLIKKIASKKGITEAALKVFAKKHFDKLILQAVRAGYKRTKELNRG